MSRRPGLIRGRYLDLLLLLALGTLWGSSYLFIKVAVAAIPPSTLVAGRLTAAALLLWVVLRIVGRPVPRSVQMWRVYAVLGLFGAAVPYLLITWGEQYISSGLAALLQSTTPIFAVLLAAALSTDERITIRKTAGVAVGFVGVALLILPELRDGVQATVLGQLAIVGSSVCYAWVAIYSRGRLRGQPPLTSAAGQLTMGAVFTLPLSLLMDGWANLSPSLPALASWASLTLVGTVLAYGLYFALLERTSATYTTMVTYVIPINGLILGALVLDESLDAWALASLALVLVGVVLVRGR
jgi:drug/metabolite transporter (DMT)-like permease